MEKGKNFSFTITDSPHKNKKGYDTYELKNGHEMEYLKIGYQGEIILFICGILDDSIVTFSNMPVLIDKAEKGLCQLYFVNLPGNGYSTIPDKHFFNPIYLKLCLEEFILAKGLKEFSVVGNSNGCTVSVLLLSSDQYGNAFKIKKFWGFNPLLKRVSFWEMDKYQKLLVKSPSSMVQCIIQTPLIGRQLVKFTLGSVENQWTWNVPTAHVDSFYNRLSSNYRCGIWSAYLKNALNMMDELKEICDKIYPTIADLTEQIILYSNPGDNWVPHEHVKEIADRMKVKYIELGNGHIPQRTHSQLVENEILKYLNF